MPTVWKDNAPFFHGGRKEHYDQPANVLPPAEPLTKHTDGTVDLRRSLDGAAPCLLPRLSTATDDAGPVFESHAVPLDSQWQRGLQQLCDEHGVSSLDVVGAAWAILLAQYLRSEEVGFARLTDGGRGSIAVVQHALRHTDVLVEIAQKFHAVFSPIEGGQQAGDDPSPDLVTRTFNTAVLDRTPSSDADASQTMAMGFDVVVASQPSAITLLHRTALLSRVQGERIAHTLGAILQAMLVTPLQTVAGIAAISAGDIAQIHEWNASVPPAVDRCAHELLRERATLHPDKTAVTGHDGSFTFGELDRCSSRLARHLCGLGVGLETPVPLCFEKSVWAVVAMFAVLKAGGCFVPLDPAHPTARRQQMVAATGAKLGLTSAMHEARCPDLFATTVVVGPQLLSELEAAPPSSTLPPKVPSSAAAYMMFTSGSTGAPKAVVIEHASLCTAAVAQAGVLYRDFTPRIVQFCSYAFDMSLFEIMTTLLGAGGCVCVPSDAERTNDLAGAMERMGVNAMCTTPSVASLLGPAQVPGLQMLMLVGEPMTRAHTRTWAEQVRLMNVYGPTECSMLCVIFPDVARHTDPTNIGRGVGCVPWIVDPADDRKLAPIGAIGELLIEGPLVAREYFQDPAKTALAFVEDPAWALAADSAAAGARRRMYKTGDLVRYYEDGCIKYVGRKDTQVKVRGQRVELGEVEYRLKQCFTDASDVVVELVKRPAAKDGALVAFVGGFEGEDTSLWAAVSELGDVLPAHMIPSALIPQASIPLSTAGKADRKRLRQMAMEMSESQFSRYTYAARHATDCAALPVSARRMASVWERAFCLDPGSLTADANFFALGGDSIKAIEMVAMARAEGLGVTTEKILLHPMLVDLSAAALEEGDRGASRRVEPYKPFGALRVDDVQSLLDEVILPQISLPDAEIEDVLPATDLQAWSVAFAMMDPPGIYPSFTFEFTGPVDTRLLESCCQRLVAHHALLRTVFVPHGARILQVVLKQHTVAFTRHTVADGNTDEWRSIMQAASLRPGAFGTPLVSFQLIEAEAGPCHLVMRAPHAQWDGASIPLLAKSLRDLYLGQSLAPQPTMADFIHEAAHREPAAKAFWRDYLAGSAMTNVTARARIAYQNSFDAGVSDNVPSGAAVLAAHGITFATVLRAAWALVLAELSHTAEVVFGHSIGGRTLPLAGIEAMYGCSTNIIPVRLAVDAALTVRELLQQTQDAHVASLPHHHLGFQGIVDGCAAWPPWTRFSSVVEHLNIGRFADTYALGAGARIDTGIVDRGADVADLWVASVAKGAAVEVTMFFCSRVVAPPLAEDILQRLCAKVRALSAAAGMDAKVPFSPACGSGAPVFPLPVAAAAAAKAGRGDGAAGQTEEAARRAVEAAWADVFAAEDWRREDRGARAWDTPFYDIRGSLVVAALLAAAYGRRGAHMPVEAVLEHPTMRAQMALLRKTDSAAAVPAVEAGRGELARAVEVAAA